MRNPIEDPHEYQPGHRRCGARSGCHIEASSTTATEQRISLSPEPAASEAPKPIEMPKIFEMPKPVEAVMKAAEALKASEAVKERRSRRSKSRRSCRR